MFFFNLRKFIFDGKELIIFFNVMFVGIGFLIWVNLYFLVKCCFFLVFLSGDDGGVIGVVIVEIGFLLVLFDNVIFFVFEIFNC